MTQPCTYHWHLEKTPTGRIQCAECQTHITEIPSFVDIGHDVFIRPTMHSKTCALREEGPGGYLVLHFTAEGRGCEGTVPTCKACGGDRAWDVVGEGPTLTLSPSILCGATIPDHAGGFHGFIQNGKWVQA